MSTRKFDDVVAAEIRTRYEEGASLNMLAATYGSNTITIKNTVLRVGGQMRPIGTNPNRVRRPKQLPGRPYGSAHHNWKGGSYIQGGYRFVLVDTDDLAAPMMVNNGYVLEHRYVMAHALGRPLTSHETVHHINGVRLDNRIENLQLRQGKHGNGVVMICADCGSANVVPKELS